LRPDAVPAQRSASLIVSLIAGPNAGLPVSGEMRDRRFDALDVRASVVSFDRVPDFIQAATLRAARDNKAFP